MYKIQANASGTREIEVSAEHLLTIDRHSLFRNLVDSNGIQKLIKLYDEWHAHYVEQDKEETVEQ